MREILFRGKQIKDGKWIEGYYCPKPYSHFPCEPTIFPFETINKDWHGERVDPKTVGQYTGLTDKNGGEIFEGDIVERGGRIWLVEYSNKYGQFMMTTYTEKGISWSRSFDLIPPDWCEVIGNIYDNPELLKGGNENG